MGIRLGMDVKTGLTQTLTPQQIQYLKLLQLPVIQFEQHLQKEIESNPMLEEEMSDLEYEPDARTFSEGGTALSKELESGDLVKQESAKMEDTEDPFEFYKMTWQDDSTYKQVSYSNSDSDDSAPFQIKQQESLSSELLQQLELLELSRERMLLGIQIIGNIDDSGYLRREINEIIDETNSQIAEHNFKQQQEFYQNSMNPMSGNSGSDTSNPALKYALEQQSMQQLDIAEILKEGKIDFSDKSNIASKLINNSNHDLDLLKPVSADESEELLYQIRHLDPIGIGSRDVQECLIAQLEVKRDKLPEEELAMQILEKGYDAFTKKHYIALTKQFSTNENALKEAIEIIKRLNPKPGETDFYEQTNTVIPDFIITTAEDKEELIITINDGHTPSLKLNRAYETMKREAEFKTFNKETKGWIRAKHEDAKFLIQAIRQRKNTMLKVMTAIAHKQEHFFLKGDNAIKPMIYKDVSEDTGLDISTVCRIVNGKYTQTDYGTFELKYFFSESLPSTDGEDISTKVIKQVLKVIIEKESKTKPYSDDKLSLMLKEEGYQVARRTVAKYREQMKIPVARLRKEL